VLNFLSPAANRLNSSGSTMACGMGGDCKSKK
jgi:hypothetical protein